MFATIKEPRVVGWLLIAAVITAIAAVARWYIKTGGVSGYSGEDRERIDRVRIQKKRDSW